MAGGERNDGGGHDAAERADESYSDSHLFYTDRLDLDSLDGRRGSDGLSGGAVPGGGL